MIRRQVAKMFGVQAVVEKEVEGGPWRWVTWTLTKDPSGG